MVASWRRRETWLIAPVVLTFTATIVAFFVVGRFRLPLAPFLAIYAALPGPWVARPAGDCAALALAAVWLVACAAFTFQVLPFHDRQVNLATSRNLGSLQARVGRYTDAAGSYERALALQPDSDLLNGEAALVYLQLDRPGDAERALVHATALHPDFLDGWMLLGQLYEATGRTPLAITAFQRAIALDPTDADLRHHPEALQQATP